MANIVQLDKPQKVNRIEWAIAHPNCDALIIPNKSKGDYMCVVAFAVNEVGNQELQVLNNNNPMYGIFGGIDASMLNYIGGLL